MLNKNYITNSKEPFFEVAKSYIKSNSKVLDIGAGSGSFPKYFKRKDFYLLDHNKLTIEKLKEKYPNVIHCTLPKLPFNSGFFDIVHCSHVVEHLSPQIFFNTLIEIDRCLSNKGYLIVSAPLLYNKFYDDLSHVKPYNPEVFLRYMSSSDGIAFSQEKISDNYELINLIYRYREVGLTKDLYNIKKNYFVMFCFKFLNLLYRLGLRKYIKTGYTLVLQKNDQKNI